MYWCRKKETCRAFQSQETTDERELISYKLLMRADHLPFKKLRWFSKIWLISWIHSWRTPGLAECKTKVSVASPVLDVSANLHGSLSTFSSRERQLTFTQKENFLYVFSEKHTAQIFHLVAQSQISKRD